MPIIISTIASIGFDSTPSTRVRQSGSIVSTGAPASASVSLPAGKVHRAAVDLLEQVVHIGRDDFDHTAAQRFVGRQAAGLQHRLLGEFGIAAAQLRQAADVGCGIVDRLFAHRIGRTAGRPPFGCLGGVAFFSSWSWDRGRALLGLVTAAGHPPIATGVAAPRLVAGAIAAMWLAYRM